MIKYKKKNRKKLKVQSTRLLSQNNTPMNHTAHLMSNNNHKKIIFALCSHKHFSAFLTDWILKWRILKDTNKFSIILKHLPLKEGVTLHFNKLGSSAPKTICFVPYFIEIGPVVLKKTSKMWKVLRRKEQRNAGQKWSK